MKLFHILRGVASGLMTPKTFALFFDWFYPDYYQIIAKALNAFLHDDELLLTIFKFLAEIVNNRSSRLRIETWNINGIYAFKDTAKIVIRYLQLNDNLKSK